MNLVENHFFSFTKFSQSNNGQWTVTPSTNTSRLVTVDCTMSLSDTYFVKTQKQKVLHGSAVPHRKALQNYVSCRKWE